MSLNSKRKKRSRAAGKLAGAVETLDRVRARTGKSVIRADTGQLIQKDETVDLVQIQEQIGKTPAFNVLDADPMRAFTPPRPVASTAAGAPYLGGAFSEAVRMAGKMGPQVLQDIEEDTKIALDAHRRLGETDDALFIRLMKEGKLDRGTELNRLLSRDMKRYDPKLAGMPPDFPRNDQERETAENIAKILEGLPQDRRARVVEAINVALSEPDQDGFFHKVLGVMKHLDPGQQERMLEALRVKDRQAMIQILREPDAEMTSRLWHLDKDASNQREKLDVLKARLDVIEELKEMAEAPRLERLGETCFHKCVEAWRAGEIILPDGEVDEALPDDLRDSLDIHTSVFVVQHDWARAFERASDFAEGEFKMPFNHMVFEFRITGRRVCLTTMCAEEDGVVTACMLNVETKRGWALGAAYVVNSSLWKPYIDKDDLCSPILNLCKEQVRAMCIALEAEVAVTEVVRAPHRLNRKRERQGRLPIFDHHVVSLANRKRYALRDPLPSDIEEEHHGKRLHFVRGHWRHYTNSKTWIKWHLRGNPDLGYVDKEYRL